jgi:hypothetical protein
MIPIIRTTWYVDRGLFSVTLPRKFTFYQNLYLVVVRPVMFSL